MIVVFQVAAWVTAELSRLSTLVFKSLLALLLTAGLEYLGEIGIGRVAAHMTASVYHGLASDVSFVISISLYK